MKSGIYKITCIVNKKFYIGSSNDIQRRWQEHKSYLRSGSHQNNHLQRAWNKYGEKAFTFSVIEYVSETVLFDIEQSYLDRLKACEKGFNQTKLAGGCGHDRLEKEYIVTLPSGKEIQIKNLSKFCREQNLGNGLFGVARGLTNQDSGYKARFAHQTQQEWESTLQRSDKHGPGWKGKYQIISPTGDIEIVKSLHAFCKLHKLSQGSLRQTCIGTRKHYKGFSATYIQEDI